MKTKNGLNKKRILKLSLKKKNYRFLILILNKINRNHYSIIQLMFARHIHDHVYNILYGFMVAYGLWK